MGQYSLNLKRLGRFSLATKTRVSQASKTGENEEEAHLSSSDFTGSAKKFMYNTNLFSL